MIILSIDLSTNCGWAYFDGTKLLEYGCLTAKVENFNVNDDPHKQANYPYNIVKAANRMAELVFSKYGEKRPDAIVVENTTKGKNRHTQRLIEFYHKSLLDQFQSIAYKVKYMDVSEWRSIINLRLTTEDKKTNKQVKQKIKRGKITKKHLSVRKANELFNLELKMKHNNEADAILLGYSYAIKVDLKH